MSRILWKVRAIRQLSVFAKGMEVDLVVENCTGKPYIKDIAKALTPEYDIKDLSNARMFESNFEFIRT